MQPYTVRTKVYFDSWVYTVQRTAYAIESTTWPVSSTLYNPKWERLSAVSNLAINILSQNRTGDQQNEKIVSFTIFNWKIFNDWLERTHSTERPIKRMRAHTRTREIQPWREWKHKTDKKPWLVVWVYVNRRRRTLLTQIHRRWMCFACALILCHWSNEAGDWLDAVK